MSKRNKIDYGDNTTCPKCQSKNIHYEYTSCRCCRTYEGDGRTCWTYPICKDCGFTVGGGAGNSSGGCWYSFVDRENPKEGYYLSEEDLEEINGVIQGVREKYMRGSSRSK